jgi:putative endonuclease
MPAVTPPGGGRATGRRGEELAAQHLRRRGFTILARNLRTGAGEIDLIATDGSTIVFAEVKTTGVLRAPDSDANGAATPATAAACVLERLGPRQRRRVRGLALDWLRGQPPTLRSAGELRFDAIGVVLGPAGELLALEHLEGAW